MPTSKLGPKFYSAPTLDLAPRLLGKTLVSLVGGWRTAGVILEVEAYLGEEDRACHARHGVTDRNRVMYGPPGHAYIYFIYGMHHCLNVVTEAEGFPAAILIRALRPTAGLELMRKRRGRGGAARVPDARLSAGPGMLCQALGLDRRLNGASLSGDILFIERSGADDPKRSMVTRPRVGLGDSCGSWRDVPWNFSLTVS